MRSLGRDVPCGVRVGHMGEAEVAEDIAQHDGAEQACAQGVCVERELVGSVCAYITGKPLAKWDSFRLGRGG